MNSKKSSTKSSSNKKRTWKKNSKSSNIEKVEDAASRFHRNNYELQAKTLLILRARITAKDTPDEALQKVLEAYPDPALADEALDFLD